MTQFLDVVLFSEHTELVTEECDIQPGSKIAGKTLAAAKLRQDVGVSVLAIDLLGEIVITHPTAETELPIGARLIVLGTKEQLEKLHELIT